MVRFSLSALLIWSLTSVSGYALDARAKEKIQQMRGGAHPRTMSSGARSLPPSHGSAGPAHTPPSSRAHTVPVSRSHTAPSSAATSAHTNLARLQAQSRQQEQALRQHERALQQERQAFEQFRRELEAHHAHLTQQQQAEIAGLKSQLTQSQTDLNQLQAAHEQGTRALQEENTRLYEASKSKEAELNAKLESLQEKLVEAEGKLRSVTLDRDLSNEENVGLQEKLSGLEKEREELKRLVENHSANAEQMRRALKAAQSKLNEIELEEKTRVAFRERKQQEREKERLEQEIRAAQDVVTGQAHGLSERTVEYKQSPQVAEGVRNSLGGEYYAAGYKRGLEGLSPLGPSRKAGLKKRYMAGYDKGLERHKKESGGRG
jgi:DNA repair exonuclease SbcCD ATPase subunit